MLSPQACYAIKALAYVLNAPTEPVPVHEIAQACGIPQAFLAKIMHRLARKQIIGTRRGVGGGVTRLADHPLEALTLHDLCVALDDAAVAKRCLIGEAECTDERACPAHAFWSPQRKRLQQYLRRSTMKEVAAFEKGRPPESAALL